MTDARRILAAVHADDKLAHFHANGDDPWEEPVPLGARPVLPTFPVDALPGWVAEQVAAVAEFTQTPVDLPGCIALAALSTAAGGRAVVNVRGSWTEPVNIFTVVAMPPASRKSSVFRAMTGPLLAAERYLLQRVHPQIVEAELARRVAKGVADKTAHAAAENDSSGDPEALAEATSAAMAVDDITVPVKPRLVADDITPEKAASLLAEQGGRLAVLSAEGGIFATLAGRYSATPNLEVFLKGHAGDMLRVDRQGRPTEHIDHAALTLGLAVQPEVIRDIATMPGFRGKGLLGRILYALPASNIGRRRINPDPVPESVAARYDTNLQNLVNTLHDWDDPARLQLTRDADQTLLHLEETTEPRLHPDTGDLGHLGDWAGKYVGAVARLAGLIHLASHIHEGWRHPIEPDSMRAAVRLGEYFTTHAVGAFDAMGADPDLDAACAVHAWLERTRPEQFTVRELFTALPRSRFRKVTDLEQPLALLEQHGWIRRQPEPPRNGPGRPPSPAYAVHPRLHGPGAQPPCTTPEPARPTDHETEGGRTT
ncbi:MAG: YfjI family protein [Streptosporangiaceae bacterium]